MNSPKGALVGAYMGPIMGHIQVASWGDVPIIRYSGALIFLCQQVMYNKTSFAKNIQFDFV